MTILSLLALILRQSGTAALLAALLLAGIGCATNKIDWQSRVGSYTYDQAVLELGPPDKSATLADGTKVVDWLTGRGFTHGTYSDFGSPFYHRYYYPGPRTSHYTAATTPDSFIRLTFSPDGKLAAWRRVYR
jgi:hypothetical protein